MGFHVGTFPAARSVRDVTMRWTNTETASNLNSYAFMPEVTVLRNEPIDRALKRLKSKMEYEGIMEEVRRLRAFETPAQKTKRKAKNNAKRRKMKRNRANFTDGPSRRPGF